MEAVAAEAMALADRCVACGACLPHCPTYRLLATETDSPRGRLFLLRALNRGALGPEDVTASLERCLGCGACERVCPAQVPYTRILAQARAAGLRRGSLRETLLLGLARCPWLVNAVGRLGAGLPGPLVAPAALAENVPARGGRRGRVQLFLGCIARAFDAHLPRAAVALLTAQGWEVQIPRGQACCGGLSESRGRPDPGFAAINARVFSAEAPVITLASGCTPALAATLPGRTVAEITGFVHSHWRDQALRPGPQRVYVHVPCTQKRFPCQADAALQLLSRLPGCVAESALDADCCGAAGSYMLLQPGPARLLRDRAMAAMAPAPLVVTTNTGCAVHLAAGFGRRGPRVTHPVILLAEAMSCPP